MGWKELVGKKILFIKKYSLLYKGTILEGVVEEVSPSGKYVKIRTTVFPYTTEWYETEDIKVLEVLG